MVNEWRGAHLQCNSQAGVALPSSGTTDHNQLLHFLSTCVSYPLSS